jgi:uncharacterized SAM-binding protein YcdF (DUF218 family)
MLGLGALMVMWLVQTRPFAEWVIAPLENAYVTPSFSSLAQPEVFDVVVLTGGGFPTNGDLLSSSFPHASMYRMMAGLELCRHIGSRCRMTFSGSSGALEMLPIGLVMEKFTRELMPDVSAQSEAQSNSTAEHPGNVRKLIGQNQFFLVTSAYHMPRSMLVFERAGLHPIPYPVDRYVYGDYSWRAWLPSADNLVTMQIAFHEYIGLIQYTLVYK